MGFGSDGYLYDFVKRSPKYSSPKYFGYGSDGFLYDFVKRAPRMRGPGYRRYNYGFGSDGYLYDFVKKRSSGLIMPQHRPARPRFYKVRGNPEFSIY